jgi:hypothetical protein
MARAWHLALTVGAMGLMGAVAAFGQSDLIVGDLNGPNNIGGPGPRKWGSLNGVTAYTVGTTSCNKGDVPVNWFGFNANHPVITQQMFRLKDGRIDQIGMSWAKHGLCALQETLCSVCQPQGPNCEVKLGVGCSDPYSSQLNGDQTGMGPPSEVDASTGFFKWPYSTQGQSGNVLYKRIQVSMDDLDPGQNPGAIYVAEGMYVVKDDAAAGTDLNNASYRLFKVGSLSADGYELNWINSTKREEPAIFAWQEHGLGLNTPDPDVILEPVDVDEDGRFWVGYKVTDNLDGTWHYEYAIQNLNSHRSGGSFDVPVPAGVAVSNIDFKDIDYHSGEPYDPTDWSSERTASSVLWSSPQTFDENENSNALRWGTLYNFSFDADTPPTEGFAEIGLFRPGVADSPLVAVQSPSAGDCVADFNGDGLLNILDFIALQEAFQAGDQSADINGDGTLNVLDFIDFQSIFQNGC